MISKKQFIAIIESIKRYHNFECALNDTFKKYTEDSFITLPYIDMDIVLLLQEIMNDEDKWISYFCYELDFGSEYTPGTVLDENNNEIPLATIQDLYNLLTTK